MPRDDYGFDVEEEDTEEPEPLGDVYETGAPEREDIATEVFETGVPPVPTPPAPMPRPPGIAPDIGRRSYMEALGRIEPPALEPLPQYPVGKPGFKGAMMDALRGMIPGYVQGRQAALRARQAEVTLANKQRMDLFREQLDIIRPMMLKDYETEAWLQKTQSMARYLRRTYPDMPEYQVIAYSMGRIPRAPERPRLGTTETAVLDDGSTVPVAYGDMGVIDLRTGKAMDPALQARIKEVRGQLATPPQPRPPEETRGLIIPEGLPGAGRPGTRVVHPDGRVEWLPEYERPRAGPSADVVILRQLAIEKAREDLRNKQSMEITPRQMQQVNQQNAAFQRSDTYKGYEMALRGMQAIRNMDRLNPNNQLALVFALNKMWDPTSVVREGEVAAVRKFATTIMSRLGLDIMRVVENRGFMTQQEMGKLIAAAMDQFKGHQQVFHTQRNDAIRRAGKAIGMPAGSWINDLGAGIDEEDKALGFRGRIRRENKQTGEIDEYIAMPDGTFMLIEK